MPIAFERPEPGSEGRKRPRRLWTVLLAPKLTSGVFEGYPILDEIKGEFAAVVFRCFRDGYLWATTPEEVGRDRLFTHGPRSTFSAPPEILSAVRVFDGLWSASPPAPSLANAAAELAAWARGRGYLATEYHFAALASYVSPRDPELAFVAGRAARQYGRTEDARVWFRRTIGLARRAGDDAAYANGYLGLGILEERQGRRSEAIAHFQRAWKAARRGGLHELMAAARHNMIGFAVEDLDFRAGQRHIVAAFKLYGRGNPLLYRLANDAAVFWSNFGMYSIALMMFEAVLPHTSRDIDRMAVLANISRAAAELGENERYLSAWDEALELDRSSGESVPEIYLELALGAEALGFRRRARDLAESAVAAARKLGRTAILGKAESFLDSLVAGRPRERLLAEPEEDVQRFAARFLSRLL